MGEPLRQGPLAGLLVIDFGQYIAGPGVAMMLADQGADVVRIERPGGPAMNTPASAVLNRGKRSLILDLKDPADHQTARRLVQSADVVIENFRPGVMDRLQLGPQAVTAANPRVVYLSLPGFAAADAAYAGVPGWEGVVASAMGQFTDMGLNRVLMGIAASYSPLTLASAYASVFGALAVVLALRARERTGVGDVIEVPLAAALMEGLTYNSLSLDQLPERYKSLREREIDRRRSAGLPMDLGYDAVQPLLDPFYRTYVCKDGRPFYVVCLSHARHPERALQVLGLWDEMVQAGVPCADPYLPIAQWPNGEQSSLRSHPIVEPWASRLAGRMADAFLTRDSMTWERLFGEAGAPGAAHRTTQEWLQSEHPHAAGLIVPVDDPRYGRMAQPGPLVWLQDCPPVAAPSPAPLPDQHAWSIRREADAAPAAPASGPATGAEAAPWLAGITILDMTNVVAGPTIAGTLARFGARVIKLDPVTPTFDPWNTIIVGLYANQGKESILVDVKTAAGRAVLERLIAQVDIITINATDRQLPGLGLGIDEIRRINPAVILGHLDAFGGPDVGPRSAYPGYDDLIQASTGIMERFGGSLATVEEHAHFGTIDVLGGLSGGFAIALALLRRERTGRGDVARTSLAAAGQWLQTRYMYDFDGRGPFDEPRGRMAKGEGALYRCYRARDCWFFLAGHPGEVGTLAKSEALAAILTVEPALREAWLEAAFAKQPLAYWKDALRAANVAVQPLESLSAIRAAAIDAAPDRHTVSFHRDEYHPSGHAVEHIRPVAVRSARAPLVPLAAAEKYGASTRRILQELGFDADAVSAMAAEGAIGDRWSDQYLPD